MALFAISLVLQQAMHDTVSLLSSAKSALYQSRAALGPCHLMQVALGIPGLQQLAAEAACAASGSRQSSAGASLCASIHVAQTLHSGLYHS